MSTLALTHEAISKALTENMPLTDDQRAALLGLVARDKQAQMLEDDVGRLVRQVRELCAATQRAGPGVAVEIPAELAEQGRKFMRGEPNLIVQMPFADVSSLGELLADNPQYS